MARLTQGEVACVRFLGSRFEQGRQDIQSDEIIQELGIDEGKYEPLIQTMEAVGACLVISSSDGIFAGLLSATVGAVQLCRELDANEQAKESADIVEQVRARVRRNPVTAWAIIIVLAIGFLIPIINGAVELWEKLFGGTVGMG